MGIAIQHRGTERAQRLKYLSSLRVISVFSVPLCPAVLSLKYALHSISPSDPLLNFNPAGLIVLKRARYVTSKVSAATE
jgi:hypothetical protein